MPTLFLGIFILTASIFYLGGLEDVPYHPDESTQIFMSSDVRAFFRQPGALVWQPEKEGDQRQYYHEMDAPLSRYLIGMARWIAGLPDQALDWNWSWSWQLNQAAGALPDERSLWISRLAVAGLFPFSLVLVYLNGKALGGRAAGWAAMLLFTSNALVLLHTRRAMAESALVMTSLLSVWAMLCWKRHVWLVALPLALAFNAKQSAAALVLPGLVALIWQPERSWKQRVRDGLLFGLVFVTVTLALNPFLWEHPFAAARSAMQARAQFTANMAEAITRSGAKLPGSLLERVISVLAQVFLAEPSFAETGNYTHATLSAETAYLASPLHRLLRGLAGGGALLALTLLGMLLACIQFVRQPGQQRRAIAVLLIATLTQFLALGWVVTIPFQRYYLVLAPFACLWVGYALADFGRRIRNPSSSIG